MPESQSLDLEKLVADLIGLIQSQSLKEFSFEILSSTHQSEKDILQIIEPQIRHLDEKSRMRIYREFLDYGPLDWVIKDPSISEIMINNYDEIWVERDGCLTQLNDRFLSPFTYQLFLSRTLVRANGVIDKENPILDRSFEKFRICMIDECLTQKSTVLCMRRHPEHQWTLEKLQHAGWCSGEESELLKTIVLQRKRFLVIGPTGCGKTSAVNALLEQTDPNCRSIIIEDTPEITGVNASSVRLVTRSQSPQLKEITQTDLVKSSLRMRPDRLIMGEIRGSEAKDFLLALSTGHNGSFGSLHASDPQQAMIRLEMLIQMGAPNWNVESIRKLIFLSLDGILVLGKEPDGKRVFKGAYQITSLEPSGFLMDRWVA